MQSSTKLLRICGIRLVLRKTLHFYALASQGQEQVDPSWLKKIFRNVSIITAWNSQKDRINELGSVRFATETNQHLIVFYSIDKWVIYEDIPEKVTGHKRRKRVKSTESSTNITNMHIPTNQETKYG